MLTSDNPPNDVRLVGPYRVGSPIGMGVTANVLEGVHVDTGERVALKILSAEWAEQAEMVSRFVREGRALQRLRHPNIVRVIDHGVTDYGAPWIALERLRAITLATLIQESGRLEPARAVRLVIDVARALGAVHAAGIVHRDIKPENVLVVDPDSPAESAKLIDFGIAKVTAAEVGENSNASLTRAGAVLGSIAFAAPEQLGGSKVDARSDVFALAVTLYEALSGELPFDGHTVEQQVHARRTGAVVPLQRRGVTVPRALGEFFVSALSSDVMQRPADGQAMYRMLVALLPELDSKHRIATSLRPTKPPPPPRRVGALTIVMIVLAVLIGAALAAHVLHLLPALHRPAWLLR